MSLVEYAERELRAAGLFDEDSDYGGMLGNAVLELVQTFADQGHSGYSAYTTRQLFNEVSDFKPLTPITSNPEDWMHIDAEVAGNATTWQCRRQPSLFSRDGGKTWYDVDDPRWNQRIRGWRFRKTIRRG